MHCDCYHVIEEKPGKFSGECWGTKERDRVNCSGYTELCSNGLKKSKPETPETPEIGLMYTAEMMVEAARTHETYQCGNMLFNTTKSFFGINDGEVWPISAFKTLQEIFNLQWVEYKGQVMTKAEAESKYNIKIIG